MGSLCLPSRTHPASSTMAFNRTMTCCKFVCQNIVGPSPGSFSSHTLCSIHIAAYSSATMLECRYQHAGTAEVVNQYSLMSQSTQPRTPFHASACCSAGISRHRVPSQTGAILPASSAAISSSIYSGNGVPCGCSSWTWGPRDTSSPSFGNASGQTSSSSKSSSETQAFRSCAVIVVLPPRVSPRWTQEPICYPNQQHIHSLVSRVLTRVFPHPLMQCFFKQGTHPPALPHVAATMCSVGDRFRSTVPHQWLKSLAYLTNV